MAKSSSKRSSEWSRCAEGFSDVKLSSNINKIRKSSLKRKSSETAVFNHGNIFEKLFGGTDNEKSSSQNIAWSSSDSEQEDKQEKNNESGTKVQVVKRRRRSSPAPTKKPSTRSQRLSLSDTSAVTISDTDPEEKPQQSPVSSTSRSTEASISGYESGSEASKPHSTQSPQQSESPSQASISTVESATSPVTQTGTGLKASDWVKSLQLKTPTKTPETDEQKDEFEESTKKKKKQSRGGLADQLTRLRNRDKSSVRMWTHQQSKALMPDSKAATLQVLSHETLYSLEMVRCVMAPTDQQIPSSETSPDRHNLPGTSTSEPVVHESSTRKTESLVSRLVMFPASQSEQLNLQIGSRFKLFPPWQQLELSDGQLVLLCTKYCQVLSDSAIETDGGHTPDVRECEATSRVSVRAKWNCPCVQGLCRSPSLCPAYQFPAVAGLVQEVDSNTGTGCNRSQGKDSNSNLLTSKPSPHLHTISSSASHVRTSKSLGETSKETVCNSLLKSIEEYRQSKDTVSIEDPPVVEFTAHVHRHSIICEKNGKKRHSVFVEDSVGTVSQILLSTDTVVKQSVNTDDLEGKTFQFSGLVVQDRVTRDKESSLFTMVDAVWSGHCSVDSQDSLTASQSNDGSRIQSYCYVLTDRNTTDVTIKSCTHSILQRKSLSYTQLCDLSAMDKPCRCTCVVRLLYVHKQFGKLGSYMLYVTDSSLQKPSNYMKIPLSRDFSFSLEDRKSTGLTIVTLRDLIVNQVGVKADGYSQLDVLDPKFPPDNHTSKTIQDLRASGVELDTFSNSVLQDDLCYIKGKILEVDEESAYSWEACPYCDSDQLQTSPQGSSTCLACKRPMSEPVTKMKMEVIIASDANVTPARVNLLQPTIERLLPADEGDDEGYELSSVLNKTIGPLQCIVTAVQHRYVTLQQIQLLH